MKTQTQIACDTMDWLQVVHNGGPPCFHLEEGRRFCGRAQRWFGHEALMHGHAFTSLSDLVSDSFDAGVRKGRIAGLREAANHDTARAESASILEDAANWRECAEYHNQEADRLEREATK